MRDGWTFLGELARRPMFSAQHWGELVSDHAPPNALLVATDGPHATLRELRLVKTLSLTAQVGHHDALDTGSTDE